MVSTVNNIPTPPALQKADAIEIAKQEAAPIKAHVAQDKNTAPVAASKSTQVEKFANKVTITVKDAKGTVLFEHPPKKALAYQQSLNEDLRKQQIITKHNLSKQV